MNTFFPAKKRIMGLFGHLKNALNNGSIKDSAPAAPVGGPPTERSIYQSRQNFGVNFGSLFVLEKYIFDEMYVEGGNAECEAIASYARKNGIDATRTKMENHWLNYCSDSDWEWLKSKGIQSIRIPIGYWTVNGGQFTRGTNFESISGVYVNAWNILKDKYINKAKQYNISILVDLHGLPKGANTGDHSGETFKEAGFWNDHKAIDLAVDVCAFIANDLKNYDNVSGLQIVNESVFSNNPSGQERYYRKASNEIRKYNQDIPIIISDGWWPKQWIDFLSRESNGNIGSLGIVIDDHIYRCFSDDDKRKRVEDITNDLPNSVIPEAADNADFIIGEYSCVLDTQSWNNSGNANRDELVKNYGNKQTEVFKRKAKTGTYFWTFKFQNGDGGEWGIVPMIDRGCIPPRNTNLREPSKEDFDNIFNNIFQQHQNYWLSQNPNEKYEFWRYQEGFITAWSDSVAFLKLDNSRIGRVVAWSYARRMEHTKARGNSRFLWQWDAGFFEALNKFEEHFH